MAKPELGTKRVCPSCATKYYDLNRNPIVCPSCGAVFEPAARQKAAPARAVVPVPREAELAEDVVVEQEAEVISLEEAEEETVPDVGPEADEEEDVGLPEAEGLEIGAEIAPEDAATFLDTEEEEGDVAGLLDVDAENEDEV